MLVIALIVGSCVFTDGGPGPIPRDLVEVDVDLPPGASNTYEFDIMAEAFGANWRAALRMVPRPVSLRSDGVTVEQSWTREGVTEDGWPDNIEVGQDEQMLATLSLTLTNESQTRIQDELTVIITSAAGIPEPGEEELTVDIRQRQGVR